MPALGLGDRSNFVRQITTTTRLLSDLVIDVPQMGDSISEGSIAEILKGPGDTVEVDEVIAQIETDKVTIDIRSPSYGTISAIQVNVGDTVVVGQQIATMAELEGAPPPKAAAAAAPAPVAEAAPAAAAAPPPPPPPPPPSAAGHRVPMIKFPPRRTPDGEVISSMPAAQALAVTAQLMGVGQSQGLGSTALVGFTSAGDHPPRMELTEEEIEAIESGGAC